jgi:hypothetical protein
MDEREATLDRLDAEREVLTQSLNEIASDIGTALHDDLTMFKTPLMALAISRIDM